MHEPRAAVRNKKRRGWSIWDRVDAGVVRLMAMDLANGVVGLIRSFVEIIEFGTICVLMGDWRQRCGRSRLEEIHQLSVLFFQSWSLIGFYPSRKGSAHAQVLTLKLSVE